MSRETAADENQPRSGAVRSPGSPRAIARPNGALLVKYGGMLVVLGLGTLLLALPSPYKLEMVLLGAGLLQLGMFIWIAGMILRAMYFLPGREVRPEDLQ